MNGKRKWHTYTESEFIQDELQRYEPILEEIRGVSDYEDQRLILEVYTEFLRDKRPLQLNEKELKEYYTKFHVAAFILDSYAHEEDLPIGEKGKIEGIAATLPNYQGGENTFYKRFNELYRPLRQEGLAENILINLLGEDWKMIVLRLSKDPETLKRFLEHKV